MINELITQKVSCDLCGSIIFANLYSKSDHKLQSNQIFQVVRCQGCGLVFVNPQPTPEELYKLYPSEYYQMRGDKTWLKKYEKRLRYIANLPGRKLIDLGCAKGDFIKHIAKKGYETMGIEEVEQGDNNDSTILKSTSEHNIEQLSNSFDIVTAWGVLEHMHNPSKYFSIAHKLLKSNGHFVFLVTNADSVSSRFLFGEDIPRHVTFFTPQTIETYANKFGFELVKIYHKNDIYSMPYNDTLNWLCKMFLGRAFNHEDTISYKFNFLGKKPGFLYLNTSRVVGRIARLVETSIKRNGIITAILKKNPRFNTEIK